MRYWTTSRFPFSHACWRGVLSSLSFVSIFAPFSTRYWTIGREPFSHARWREFPNRLLASILAPFSIRYWTIGKWPFWHAIWRGVTLYLFFASTLARFSIRYWTIWRSPYWHAIWSAVSPSKIVLSEKLFSACMLALIPSFSIKYWTLESFPSYAAKKISGSKSSGFFVIGSNKGFGLFVNSFLSCSISFSFCSIK